MKMRKKQIIKFKGTNKMKISNIYLINYLLFKFMGMQSDIFTMIYLLVSGQSNK